MDKLTIDGIEVKVLKKRIKNMYLRIDKRGEVVVSAPLFLSDDNVRAFVLSREEWIKAGLNRANERRKTERTFDEGEEYYLMGKKSVLHTDTTKKRGYYLKGNELVICVGENSTVESRRKALADFYREAMEQILPDIADECQKRARLYADEWRIRDMTTRYGSCNTKEKRIWISLWLMEKPTECIEAVVYHELAHLKIKGHNREFYELLEKICPNYREAEKLLKSR